MPTITNTAQAAPVAPAQVNPVEVRSSRSGAAVSTASTISQAPRHADLPDDVCCAPSCFATVCNRISSFFSGIGTWIASFFVSTPASAERQAVATPEQETVDIDDDRCYVPPFVQWLMARGWL